MLRLGFQELSTPKFTECEPMYGVAHDDNYRCVKWRDGNVVFSFAKRGEALCCHFSAKKDSLRLIKPAINEFIEWARSVYKWCKMIMAFINKASVERIVKKCGFVCVGIVEELTIYVR